MTPAFPFSAIVGQEEMKQALLMAAVDPGLSGVLVFGDRGTGKSTVIRGLAALLPKIETAVDCRYNCDPTKPAEICPVCGPAAIKPAKKTKMQIPVIDLPLGATEDRVCGALDLEKALLHAQKTFEPGMLAKAHRGFLYIDEVNLLEDHLVDLLLDVAASGTNIVEREGLSIRHPAKFVLIGSGNPEEGELRPQLLDRFGLSVDVTSPDNLDDRVEVVRRREAYERDPYAFAKEWANKDAAVRRKITKAAKAMSEVAVSDEVLKTASRLCMKLGVDGLRGELTLMRAARAKAALENRYATTSSDIMSVATMALRHRLRRDPLDEAGSSTRVKRAISDVAESATGMVGHA